MIYRHFGAADRQQTATRLLNACRARGCVLLIAADPDLARSVGADGVHWPEARLPDARHWRGQFALQTASAHARRAIQLAEQAGMDAALISSVFASKSKSAGTPLGPARFRTWSAQTPLPLYALGGVNAGNVDQVAAAGGVAAIEGLLQTGGG